MEDVLKLLNKWANKYEVSDPRIVIFEDGSGVVTDDTCYGDDLVQFGSIEELKQKLEG